MSQPGYSSTLAVSDAAEVTVIAQTFCACIVVRESPVVSGWPRNFLVRLSIGGSSQIPISKGSSYQFVGPYAPGDVAGKIELVSNGGDSSTFTVEELPKLI